MRAGSIKVPPGVWMMRFALGLTAIAACLWLWHCLCILPGVPFNEVRLQPSFALSHGLPLYPEVDEGPVTTWIYGPLTPLLLLPATLATSAASAVLTAGCINLAVVLGSIFLVCGYWPTPQALGRAERLAAGLLCVAVWPASSFQNIQADNLAVTFGLMANLVLIRSSRNATWSRWLAAAMAVAAMGCKQTAFGVLATHLLWLGWREGGQMALQHAVRAAGCGAALAVACLAYFSPSGIWLNLIEVPAQLPWTPDLFNRFWVLRWLLAVHIGGPLLIIVLIGRKIWNRDSPWLLPTLTWIASLPAGVAALMKIGGNVNSLHGWLLFLPPAVIVLLGATRVRCAAKSGLVFFSLFVLTLRLNLPLDNVWRPRIAHLRQGELIAAQLSGQIWFPWNPLISWYSEGRLDHAEDGLFMRFVAGHPLTVTETHRFLPPDWQGTAMMRGTSDWGVATDLRPNNAIQTEVGLWTLYTWAPDERVSNPAGADR